ncbi:MAG: 4-hydroxy-tetrahydrodipicolinate synthase [Myxococcota bacterium]
MSSTRLDLGGMLTAIVTPFGRDGQVDFGALDALVERQLEAGVQGLVPCGTTGESPTLSAQERQKIIEHVMTRVGGSVPVIAGAGGNDTRAAIDNQKLVRDAGADAALVANPYYNKPTQEGLYRHYAALREAVDLPIVLYNIPGRTASDIQPATVARLHRLGGFVAIKEATGDLERIAAIRELTGEEFAILSGEDHLTLPFVALGGDGVISAVANVAPVEMVSLTERCLAGDFASARVLHTKLRPLMKALFVETNPIPAKAALAMMGLIEENYRLPLCEMQPETRTRLHAVLVHGGWLRAV